MGGVGGECGDGVGEGEFYIPLFDLRGVIDVRIFTDVGGDVEGYGRTC